ncbi:ABC transporter permease [Nocardioides sp. LHG3406-4]|uniref:ABC transporter permease n=1 Tax=Nocardioides sp. LHG3406-4 TaxID=2804575 RepID=UPI003CEE758B
MATSRAVTRTGARAGRGIGYSLPWVFLLVFFFAPLALTIVWSTWRSNGFWIEPAFTTSAYEQFFDAARIATLQRSLVLAAVTTVVGLLVSYPIAYYLAFRARAAVTQLFLMAFAFPFLVNYIIREVSWVQILGRDGVVNRLLIDVGLVDTPLDWLLFSKFAVALGLFTAYMPFMVFPIWLSLSGIPRNLIEASHTLGGSPRRTLTRVILPLSMPGVFAAVIFCFVGAFGDSAVPAILGGGSFHLVGNTISASLSSLNYPLAAAISSVVVLVMSVLLVIWVLAFDVRTLLGKAVGWERRS